MAILFNFLKIKIKDYVSDKGNLAEVASLVSVQSGDPVESSRSHGLNMTDLTKVWFK